jgi:outer membrane protein OmpA-like peptidoglycan-associated protein
MNFMHNNLQQFELNPEFESLMNEFEFETNRNSSKYIKWIQASLNQILGLNLAVNGIMETNTRSAIRSFQKQYGLTVDGVVGLMTENAIMDAVNKTIGSYSNVSPMPAPDKKMADARLTRFEKNSAMIRDFHATEIDKVADRVVASWKTGQPFFTIYVKGHTSSEGSAQYNIGLGSHRALAVRKALQKALERKQKNLSYKVLILAQSKGAREPIDTNNTEAGKSQNRRVEIFLSKKALAPLPKKKPTEEPINVPPVVVDPGITTPKLPIEDIVCNLPRYTQLKKECLKTYSVCAAKSGFGILIDRLKREAWKAPGCLAAIESGNIPKILLCAFQLGTIEIDTILNAKAAIEKCAVELKICMDNARSRTNCL